MAVTGNAVHKVSVAKNTSGNELPSPPDAADGFGPGNMPRPAAVRLSRAVRGNSIYCTETVDRCVRSLKAKSAAIDHRTYVLKTGGVQNDS